MTSDLSTTVTDVAYPRAGQSRYIEEDWDALTFRVDRTALRSEDVFDDERRAIWDTTWLYLGHESEVAAPGDFVVRDLGGRPVVLARDSEGIVRAFLNACPHRGTVIAREERGNTRFFRCFYHAWTFANDGSLVSLPGEDGYPDAGFRERLSLRTVARVEVLRGFVFVSFAPTGPSLDEHLGQARDYIEMVADHAEKMEVMPGTHQYTVWGNWKLAVENAMDGYHFGPTHVTFIDYLKRTGYVTSDEGGRADVLGNGHSVLVQSGHSGRVGLDWEPRFGEDEKARIEQNCAELAARVGDDRAATIAGTSRILYVFPNLLLFDIEALSIRRLEPTAPDRTMVDAWELAPVGEPDEVRELRNRVLGSFIGPGGLATPDDIEAYEAIQRGVQATADDRRSGVDWNDISRGMAGERDGGPSRSIDEAGIRSFWRTWARHIEGAS